ncbi:hypothetical protein PHLGIDRAFT_115687 [Phlebiopsis gigantea 11061_1 CR5-6]|uniref:Cytochrome P450 n=1 Tax=Phlebiopsis gigantea (strain 11061_1 CR5-6) TaxID=745531 RepID=A0A0C3PSA7_PHLG1|nr:hypothetical protein PHLGIDRAFT_115687 [Phlebiopsis gigantea 11061_1 CR5-6]
MSLDLAALFVCTTLLVAVLRALYNVYFHPLSRFPGPKLAAASFWWQTYVDLVEQKPWATELIELHGIYGDVVRTGPNELHFARPSAYPEIYAQKNRWAKDARLYRLFASRGSSNMMSILDYEGAKKRRDYTSPLFSRKNVLTLQPLVQTCVDTMFENMDSQLAARQFVNIHHAIKCSVVDIISAFDAPLMHALHATLSLIPMLVHFPWVRDIAEALPRRVAAAIPQTKGVAEMTMILETQVREIEQDPAVLAEYPHRTIFHEFLKDDAHRLPGHILVDEAVSFITAGTDTTSDALTFGVVHILDNPAVYARLRQEVTDAWPQVDQPPALETLERLPYLTAAIKEALRMYSGIVRPLLRVVPSNGAQISGEYIPGGVMVGMDVTILHFCEDVFVRPHVFRPERWLETDAEKLEELWNPFSRGPRSCPGVNLAWFELYLMFANLLRRYDFELHEMRSSDWRWKDCILPQYVGPDINVWAKRRTE